MPKTKWIPPKPEDYALPTVPVQPPQGLLPHSLEQLGTQANQAASRHRFADYQSRRADNTLRRQQGDLNLFARFLSQFGAAPGDLFAEAAAWRAITWGLVEAFVKWQVKAGYALPSLNVRLSTIKTYARLAMQSGTLNPQEYALIRAVQGYSLREQRRLDEKRVTRRVGLKKSGPVRMKPEDVQRLKTCQADTPQARRDALMMCLLLDHGLRAGELAALETGQLDLQSGLLRFYRAKVGKTQTHRLSADVLHAAKECAMRGELLDGQRLLRKSLKNQELGKAGLTTRAISARVEQLGQALGVPGLSAHDCRHYWASNAARSGTGPFALQQAGGWSSLAMPRRYVEDSTVANEDVLLDGDGK